MGQLCSCTRSQSANLKRKIPVKSTILPIRRYASFNGHQTLPSNVTSSPGETCIGAVTGSSTDREQETVLTPNDDPSLADDDRISAPMTQTEHFYQLSNNAISSQSTPYCDVTQPTNDYSASSTLSTSSFMTSSFDVDDDVIDDVTFMRRRSCTGSSSFRAHARLSAIVRQLLGLGTDSDNSEQATEDVDRLLRRVLTQPETASTTGSVFELLDGVIADCGLDVAIKVLVDALTPARHRLTCGHLGQVTELLRGVELLLCLVTSVSDSGCRCDATHTDEFDAQLMSSHCVTDDTTLSRRLRYRSVGRDFKVHNTIAFHPFDDDDICLPSLSVRLSGWCLCDQQRTIPLTQLLSTRCVSELALVKVNLDDGMSSWLAAALRSNTSLVRLDLRLSSLGDSDAVAELGEGLSRHRRLRTLNLAGTGLTDAALCRLLDAMSINRKLTDLDVGFNDLATGNGCLALGELLRMRRPPLRRLRMREDGITWSVSTVAPFFRSAARSPRLRCLDVGGNVLGDDGLSQLSEALLVNRTLRELNIENCQFGLNGCRALARALRCNDALRSLQMSRNAVGDEGFSEVVGALRYNRAVTSLGANQCHVGNVGLSHLLDTLRHNVTVTLVKLCYNHIGSDTTPRHCRRLRILMTSCSSLQVIKDDVIRDDIVTSRHGGVDGEWPSVGTLPISAASTQCLTSTTMRYVRSFNDVSSGLDDDVSPQLSDLYADLREVLHENSRLKILLWGNKMEPPLTRFKT